MANRHVGRHTPNRPKQKRPPALEEAGAGGTTGELTMHSQTTLPAIRRLLPDRSFDDALALKFENARAVLDIIAGEWPRFDAVQPERQLEAAWLFDRISRLGERAWHALEGD
jgi:hypothetical protein